MLLLDTNVISELRKGRNANGNVLAWASEVGHTEMFISVISVMELRIGILRLKRKDIQQATMLNNWMTKQVLPTFENNILSIDLAVANQCAALHVPNPCSERDALIAATAMVHGLCIVTRNISDFKATNASTLNPWTL